MPARTLVWLWLLCAAARTPPAPARLTVWARRARVQAAHTLGVRGLPTAGGGAFPRVQWVVRPSRPRLVCGPAVRRFSPPHCLIPSHLLYLELITWHSLREGPNLFPSLGR